MSSKPHDLDENSRIANVHLGENHPIDEAI